MREEDLIKLLVERGNISFEVAEKSARLFMTAENEFNKKNFQKAANDYRQSIILCPILKKMGVHILLAHSLILSVDWDEISKHLEENNNYLQSSGWINSLIHNKPINQHSMAIPWYTYPAIEFIETKIKENFNIFEYGTGQSTFWWADRVNFVYSVEHDPAWFFQLKNLPQNVRLSLIESEKAYADEILKYPDHCFDIIIIDGINRNQCVVTCVQKLKQNGFIIYDNSDNQENHDGVKFLMSSGYKRIDFYGLIPSYAYKNCTSIFFINDEFLGQGTLPGIKQSCLGTSCCQVGG
ncbi:MAG: group 1 glycosyl transferase [Candidatus Magnetomorum sp.]|nr:group 1 glycosyl transferase [Candidatus Magnetomorum sp.]